jgi:hypothetical protein
MLSALVTFTQQRSEVKKNDGIKLYSITLNSLNSEKGLIHRQNELIHRQYLLFFGARRISSQWPCTILSRDSA